MWNTHQCRILIAGDDGAEVGRLEQRCQSLGHAVIETGVTWGELAERSAGDLGELLIGIIPAGDADGVWKILQQCRRRWHKPLVLVLDPGQAEALERSGLLELCGLVDRQGDDRDLTMGIECALARHQGELKADAAVQALRESELRWQFALTGSGDGVWDWNAATDEVFYSPTWKAMLGYGEHEIGTSLAEWETRVHPDDLAATRAEVEAHLSGRTPSYVCEHRLRCRDGTYKWILDRGKVVARASDGRPIRVIGTHTDVTARRLAEESMRAQRDLAMALAGTHDPEKILEMCMDIGIRMTNMDSGGIYLKDEGKGSLELAVHRGLSPEFLSIVRTIPGHAPQARLVEAGCPVYTDHAQLKAELGGAVDREGLRALAVIPIRHQNKVIGCVNLSSHAEEEVPWAVRDALEGIVYQLGSAIARARARRLLDQSERNMRTFFDAIPESLAVIDREGIIIAVNDTFAARLRSTALDCIGRSIYSFVSEEVAARRRIWVEEVLRSGQIISREDNRDGHLLYHRICPVREADGNIERLVVCAVDLTDRKRTEDALRESGVRLQLCLQVARMGTWDWDLASGKVVWSHAHEELWGYEPGAFPGTYEGFVSRLHPDDVAGVVAAGREARRQRKDYLHECRVVWPDGQVRWISSLGRYFFDEQGEAVRMLGVVRDVTAERAAEEALRISEQRFRDVTFTMADWVWEVDTQGRYTFVSSGVKQMLGYDASELIGRTVFDLMPPEEAARVRAVFAGIAERREAFFDLENTVLHQDGTPRACLTNAVPLLDQQGRLLGYRGVDRDVTEQKRLEAEFRQAQKMEAIGQLAGGVAHDFNNILAAVLLHLGLLQQRNDLSQDTRDSLKELECESKRAANLTRQLLLFSRRSVLQPQTLNVNEVVDNLLKMLRRLIGEDVTIEWTAKPAPLRVEADPGMLDQLLMNLVVNARDAMPKGGRITISTALVSLDERQVKAADGSRPGRFAQLRVSDTGSGMPPEVLEHIFEPFFTTKEVGRGTGLGLATVYGIVKQHQGWITVESELGRGTTFHIFLPALEEPAPASREQAEEDPVRGGSERILLVEDEPTLRVTVSTFLRRLGYSVVEARSGVEALERWREKKMKFHLLFSDMVMPQGMSGLDLAERLRADCPDLKVLISSGYSTELVQQGGKALASVTFLQKPVAPIELAKAVRRCLDGEP